MISVDAVYQKVLAIASKEQRGYITPQEFNLFADQAQLEIFEQYFYDEDQFERRLGSDIVELLDQKIQVFVESYGAIDHGFTIPEDMYKVDYIWLRDGESDRRTYVERVNGEDIAKIKSGSLFTNLRATPVYWVRNNKIYFSPGAAHQNRLDLGKSMFPRAAEYQHFGDYSYQLVLIRKPRFPKWTYFISTNQTALYWPSAPDHQNFELHASEESELVIKILQLAGINMKDYNLAQIAGQKEISVKQQEKQ